MLELDAFKLEDSRFTSAVHVQGRGHSFTSPSIAIVVSFFYGNTIAITVHQLYVSLRSKSFPTVASESVWLNARDRTHAANPSKPLVVPLDMSRHQSDLALLHAFEQHAELPEGVRSAIHTISACVRHNALFQFFVLTMGQQARHGTSM
jgi:hypothetical protein